MRPSGVWIGYASVVALGAILAGGVALYWVGQYDEVRHHYVENASSNTRFVADKVEVAFASIYQNIRTLSLLPSIRGIDRHGTNLSEEAKTTIQQVYNNLAASVDVSEVYVLPAGFDPERIDPVTGHHEAPILAFDELIAPGNPRPGEETSKSAANAPLPDNDFIGIPDEAGIPQVEIGEYRWMKQGLASLQANYPFLVKIDGLTLPMLGSPELITCDNTVFDQTLNDADRKGLIQMVPFYGPDGKFKGAVAAIMRSNAYRALLPNTDYALVNSTTGFATRPLGNGQEAASANWVRAGKRDPGLIYSETMPVKTADGTGNWMVWAGHPNAAFETSAEADSVRKSVLASFGGIAILVVTALGVCFMVGRSLKAGAIAKANLEARVAERTAEIEFIASHDELTGLVNRNQLTQRLNDALVRVKRGEHLAVLALDIDRFKEVNDTLGHPAGDLLLKQFANRIQNVAREHDIIARFGGDEFIVVQLMVAEPQHAEQFARQAIESIREPFDLAGHSTVVGVSIGIAMAPFDGETAEQLLRNADIALYRAKGDGRGTCRFFEAAMDAALQARREQERDLRRALAEQEFVLHYQPLINAASNDISGFEALIRWNHPDRGLLSPGDFIPLAEEIGLIGPIGEWVLEQACRDATGWPTPLKVAVNLSPMQFAQQTLSHAVVGALDNSGLPPFRLELEITESALLANNEQTLKVLHQFKALGVRIAMDDFGTGFSSLSYLRSFPFDRIKIDRSFVSDVAGDKDCRAIVNAVVALGQSLGMTTTAEGIEDETQLAVVRAQGCTDLQGYYFSRPRPAGDVAAMLDDWQRRSTPAPSKTRRIRV